MVKTTLTGQAVVAQNITKALNAISTTKAEALEEIGQRGVGIVKQNTPVQSGRLRQSIGYTIKSKVVSEAKNADDAIKANDSPSEVAIGTNVVYAASVEYMSKTGSKGFFLRSFNELRPMATEILKRVMGVK